MKIARFIEVLVWAFVAWAIASHQTAIIVFALTAIWGDPSQTPPAVLAKLTYISPAFPLMLGVLAIIRIALARAGGKPWLGFSASRMPADLLIGVAAGAASVAITVASLRFMGKYFALPPLDQFPLAMHLYFATIGAIVPGVCEELYFRRMLFQVGDGLPKALLLVLSAAAFALWHIGTPAYLLHTFILGLLWGGLFVMTGRLAPSIIAHVAANAGIGVLLLNGFKITAA